MKCSMIYKLKNENQKEEISNKIKSIIENNDGKIFNFLYNKNSKYNLVEFLGKSTTLAELHIYMCSIKEVEDFSMGRSE